MNQRIAVAVLCMILLSTGIVRGEDGIGVGIILGEPTGLSIKKWISKEYAVDAAAAWSFSENDSFQLHADYLIHNFGIFDPRELGGRLPVYFGVGGRIKLEHHDNEKGRNNHDSLLGIRVPFGISYLFAQAPVELFMEIVPILDLVPDTDFDINGAIGARFYFR